MIDLENMPGILRSEAGTIGKFYCDFKQFEDLCFSLKSHYGYIWLLDIIAFDYTKEKGTLELRYLFSLIESNYQFFVIVELNKKEEMKSIAHLWSNASSCEHELSELFGFQFNRAYKGNFFSENNTVHPMLKDELRSPSPKQNKDSHGEIIQLRHPFLENNHRFHIEEKSDLVHRCDVDAGKYHIGLEKILENLHLKNVYHLVENYFSLNACNWSVLLSRIIETENSIEIPDRAKALRMVFLELSRVTNHLFSLRQLCYSLCLDRYQNKLNLWIRRLQSLIMSASGNEYAANFVRVGGTIRDVSQSWMSRVITELSELETEFVAFYKHCISSREWTENLDIQILTKTEATNRSLSGPIVRATGLNLDFRKTQPFYYYQDVDFDVPIGTSGTLLDLFSVKTEEIFQSFSIIVQVLDNLPTGRFLASDYLEFDSLKKTIDPIDEEDYISKVNTLYEVKDFDGHQFIEGSNGLMALGCLYKSHKIQRIKFLSNDFFIKSLFEQLMKGRDRNLIELLWTSLAPDMKMVER